MSDTDWEDLKDFDQPCGEGNGWCGWCGRCAENAEHLRHCEEEDYD